MKKREVLFDMGKLQRQAMYLTAGLMFAASFIYFAFYGLEFRITLFGLLLFLVLVVLGIILHELLHGIGFIVFGKAKPRQIKYGISWKDGAAYAHCMIPIKVSAYRVALLLPVILTGLIPLVISFIVGNGVLLTVSVILTAGGIGDWLIFRSLKIYKASQLVKDHPTKVGYYIYTDTADESD
ncbi:DUF3267 domain-containing protein [Terribacillus saccharophilus]|uniref:DUF3267 domain-containing protein n=1 Tax=Terribacillus saccharophilus TaxID=361277 RepID=UPI00398204BF